MSATTFLTEMDERTGQIDLNAIRDKGKELCASYDATTPFPHIVIDEMLPTPLVDICLTELAKARSDRQTVFDRV